MKWITRERPKIDRIACPWLIKNFVDKHAEFIYVPKEEVFSKAKALGAIPYDIPGAEYTHEGDYCTFDYIANAINAVRMSLIVRIPITITEPANAPTTAAVMPSTNAFMLGCLPYL